jgi:hypothetical protein
VSDLELVLLLVTPTVVIEVPLILELLPSPVTDDLLRPFALSLAAVLVAASSRQ